MAKDKSRNNQPLKSAGFTAIEAIIVIAIFVFAIGTASVFLIYSYKSAGFSFNKALAINSARKGVDELTKELREAIQSDDGSYPLSSAQDFEIIFYGDIDKDDEVEKVRYFLEEESVKKGVINPSGSPTRYDGQEIIKTISSHIKNTSTVPIFYYYDQTYSGKDTDPALETPISSENIDEVYLVGIKLKVNVDSNQLPEVLNIESKVRLRNIRQD